MQENHGIITKTMEEVMHESMIPYSECVILDRALPRVEDGLKPVQRRILFDMMELGLTPDKPYKKCARVVGDCLGKYHPHGDTSVYQALVRLAQPFNMGATLIDGQGNFGDVDGNGAAAMRYTECRLTPLAVEMMKGMGSPQDEIVPWNSNFDDQLKEPALLPGRFPNLLVNGSSGIAIGFATNIPTHNLAETIDAAIKYIDNPKISLSELMKTIKGPDFPTGGYIIAGDGLKQAYETGKGKITIRAKVHIEPGEYEKTNVVIDELPYQVNRAQLLETISKLREEKKGVLLGISDITDESDRHGTRCVIKIKKDCNYKPILDMLFKSTQMAVSYGINMVAIADGKPQTLGLIGILDYYVRYQREYVVKRTKCELDAAKKREHILEGLVIAVNNIDAVVNVIKNSKSTAEARDNLRRKFNLSERQAEAILDLRLARLTHLEVYKLEQELKELRERIQRLTAILGSKKLQMEVVKDEMTEIKKAFKSPRKSTIISSVEDYKVSSEMQQEKTEDCVVMYSVENRLKRMAQKNFGRATKRFGDSSDRSEICSCIAEVKGGDLLYVFDSEGYCHKIDPETLPEGRWRDGGTALKSAIPAAGSDAKIVYMKGIGENMPQGRLLFYTRSGMVKKNDWSEMDVAKSSFQAVKLKDGDSVIGIEEEKPGSTLLIVTRDGICLNADMSDIPTQGRIAAGVRSIQLSEGDECIAAMQVTDEGEVVLISDKSNAKRVPVGQIEPMARYRKGSKIFDLKPSSGKRLIFASYVTVPYTIILDVDDEYLSQFDTEDIVIQNRTTSGKALVRGCLGLEKVYIYKTQAD